MNKTNKYVILLPNYNKFKFRVIGWFHTKSDAEYYVWKYLVKEDVSVAEDFNHGIQIYDEKKHVRLEKPKRMD